MARLAMHVLVQESTRTEVSKKISPALSKDCPLTLLADSANGVLDKVWWHRYARIEDPCSMLLVHASATSRWAQDDAVLRGF